MTGETDRWIEEHRTQLVQALCESVRICTDVEEGEPPAPLGAGCRRALDHVLSLCSGFGISVKDLDGYIAYAEYGSGEESLGVLSHLDVVPAGEGWVHDPYGAEIEGGKLYGRGAMDDKSGAIASIFALAAIRACGIPLRRRIRLIFGCDEERSMRCIRRYLQSEAPPTLSFSPDANYPVVNREKTFYFADYGRSHTSSLTIHASDALGGVPGEAEAFVPLPPEAVIPIASSWQAEDPCGCEVRAQGAGTRVLVRGMRAFASAPQEGISALQGLLRLLSRLPLPKEDAEALIPLAETLGFGCCGEGVGLSISDETGALTLALCSLDWNETGFRLHLDIRAPISADRERIERALQPRMERIGARCLQSSYSAGYHIPEDAELVRALLGVYRSRTGDFRAPTFSRGGTYARMLPNTVGFGLQRPGKDNRLHAPDEFVELDDFVEDAKMLADAMIRLAAGGREDGNG